MEEISLSTERLALRAVRLSDAEALLKYRSDPRVYEFQYFQPRNLREVEEFIRNKISKKPNIPGTWYQLGITIKDSNQLVGDIGIHFIDDSLAEIGFTLSPEHQRKGYASEAAAGVISFLFNSLNKHRIIASVDPRNVRSSSLLERLGMRKEAHFKKSIWFKGEWTDDMVYAILDEEWAH